MDKLIFDGIEIKIIRKRIKNMYLRVNKEGVIVVSVPLFLSDDAVTDFVMSKDKWIKDALGRKAEKNSYVDAFDEGEERYLFGKKYTLHTDTSKKSGYYFRGNDIVICVGENSTVESRRKALANVYRDAMEQILPEIACRCEKKSGLYADEWRVRDMKTRWGSCNTKDKRIWISLWLIEKSPKCLEAVIFHELAHLRVKGHNKEFYALVEKICPNYRDAEKVLKK